MFTLSRRALRLLLLPSCMLAGCVVGPDFQAPAAPAATSVSRKPLPAGTVETPVHGGERQIFSAGKELPTQWWRLFGSERLNGLVEQAFADSPTVAAAKASLRSAQENLNAARGAYYPSIDAGASVLRQKSPLGSSGFTGAADDVFNLYNASISVSYVLDIFGGTQRSVEAQAAQVASESHELQAIYFTLAANVVNACIEEASLRDQIAAIEGIIAAAEKQLSITERRSELGGVGYFQVLLARSDLSSTRAALPTLRKQLNEVQNQLAVYLGALPSDLEEARFNLDEMQLPVELPVALPSSLVRQRPDIRAAEARLQSANANVGVATADMFPKFSLSGSYGSQASNRDQLFHQDAWSLGVGALAPIFKGGELNARRRAAIAEYDESVARYRQTVLGAFQDVANALVAVQEDAQRLQQQRASLEAIEAGLRLTESQYELGAASPLNLLISQRQFQQARISYAQALAVRYQDTVALFLALGGTWDGVLISSSK